MVHGLCVYCPWCGQEEDGLRLAASVASPLKPPAASQVRCLEAGERFAAAPFLFSPGDSGLSQRSSPAPLHGSCWEPSASPHEEV